jgi:hypothetical protein
MSPGSLVRAESRKQITKSKEQRFDSKENACREVHVESGEQCVQRAGKQRGKNQRGESRDE